MPFAPEVRLVPAVFRQYSKTRHERQVVISAHLAAWLKAFPGELIPTDFEALNKKVRKHFELTHPPNRQG